MHEARSVSIGTLCLALLAFSCGGGSSDADGGQQDSSVTPGKDAAVQDARPTTRSPDAAPLGNTWSKATSGTDKGLSVVIWADERFIAVGDGGTVLSSRDGTAWTVLDSGITDNLRSLTWTGTRLVAIAEDGKVLTSENGTSWTERGTNLNKLMRQVAWTGKVLSAVGRDGNTATSSDGVTWTGRENTDMFVFVPTGAVWTGTTLIWGGYNSLTSVTFNAGMAFSTKDGITFSDLSPSYSCNSIFGVAWDGSDAISGLTTEYNGRLIAAGRNGEMFTMSYGNWDSGKWGDGASSTTDLNAVIWTGLEAVAVGESSRVLRSATGHYRSWASVSVPAGADFTSVAWNEDHLVAVGSAGTIITSP